MREMETVTTRISWTPTRALASFASELRYEVIPPAAIAHVKTCLLDNLGCGLYAAHLPWCRILFEMIQDEGGSGRVTCWGQPARSTVTSAALYNGTAGHAFEFDDHHHASHIHPGSMTIPAALAAAEHVGGISGRELLTAVVAGYEVATRIGMALGMAHFFRGYHHQGTVGPFASAAAVGRVLSVEPEQMVHALGTAASQSAGLMAAQEGGMVKRLHSGRAAQSGTLAALLARRGFTGIPDALEAEFGGFLATLGGTTVDASRLTAGLGEEWQILNTGFKAYPTCAPIHTVLDGALSLMAEYGFTADDCREITAYTTTMTFVHTGFPYEPVGATAAQMNLAFALASVLRFGELGVEHFTDEAIRDRRTLTFLRERIRHVADEELDKLGTAGRHASRLEIRLNDGRRLVRQVVHRKGSLQNPMTHAEVRTKFRRLATYVIPPERVDRLEVLVDRLEELDDVRAVGELLAK